MTLTLRAVFGICMFAYCVAKGNLFLGILNLIVNCIPYQGFDNP